jgi:hypothetical protein
MKGGRWQIYFGREKATSERYDFFRERKFSKLCIFGCTFFIAYPIIGNKLML